MAENLNRWGWVRAFLINSCFELVQLTNLVKLTKGLFKNHITHLKGRGGSSGDVRKKFSPLIYEFLILNITKNGMACSQM